MSALAGEETLGENVVLSRKMRIREMQFYFAMLNCRIQDKNMWLGPLTMFELGGVTIRIGD